MSKFRGCERKSEIRNIYSSCTYITRAVIVRVAARQLECVSVRIDLRCVCASRVSSV